MQLGMCSHFTLENSMQVIPHKFWARHRFPIARAGVDTNNIIESINSAWADNTSSSATSNDGCNLHSFNEDRARPLPPTATYDYYGRRSISKIQR